MNKELRDKFEGDFWSAIGTILGSAGPGMGRQELMRCGIPEDVLIDLAKAAAEVTDYINAKGESNESS